MMSFMSSDKDIFTPNLLDETNWIFCFMISMYILAT